METLTVKHLDNIRFAKYEFQIRALDQTILPPFLGTTLRGAFGHALKQAACSMDHRDCGRCLLAARCVYPRIFETTVTKSGSLLTTRGDAPRPFIFVPPLARENNQALRSRDDLIRWRVEVVSGQRIVFGISLIGDTVTELPYVVQAAEIMARNGFGFERARFILEEVAVLHPDGKREVIYTGKASFIREHDQSFTLASFVQPRLEELCRANSTAKSNHGFMIARTTAASAFSQISLSPAASIRETNYGENIRLRFLTPTRLRIKGLAIEQPSFAQLIRFVSLRLSMIAQTHGANALQYDYKSLLDHAEKVRTTQSTLNLLSLERRSNRQDKKLDIDGVTGEISFAIENSHDYLPLLLAGEFLHVGSGTAFGLGRYSVDG